MGIFLDGTGGAGGLNFAIQILFFLAKAIDLILIKKSNFFYFYFLLKRIDIFDL
jgi:hypothetical protein